MRRATGVVLLLLLAACGKEAPPPPAAPPPPPARPSRPAPPPTMDVEALKQKLEIIQREAREKMAKAGFGEPEEPPYVPAGPHVPPPPDPVAPVVGLSANDTGDAELPPGWPLVLRFRVHASPRGAVGLPAGWVSRVRLEAGGLPLKAGPRPDGPLALDPATSGELVWTATAAELDALPRGAVDLTAVLETEAGTLRAGARIRLVAPPKRADARAELRRVGVAVDLALVRGEPSAALAAVEAVLPKRSQEAYLHDLHGDALAAAGRREEAVAAYTRAAEHAMKRKQSARAVVEKIERLTAKSTPPSD